MRTARENSCKICNIPYEVELYRPPVYGRRYIPWLKPKLAYISQYHHKGTHEKSLVHAIDFAVPIRTKVYASRDGVVADLASHFELGGDDETLKAKANYVCLRHEGGRRYSRYYHLSEVLVRKGECVKAGDVIGLSGNTGYTLGPHLHFDVVDVLGVEIANIRLIHRNGSVKSIPCLPMTFSRFPFPLEETILQLYIPDPIDLGKDNSFTCMNSALICVRDGTITFLEKARAAEKAGASLLIIVDNDEAMKDTLPILAGDSSLSLGIWVVYISFSNNELLHSIMNEKDHDNSTPYSCGIRMSPYYHERPNDSLWESTTFCKPLTYPVKFQK